MVPDKTTTCLNCKTEHLECPNCNTLNRKTSNFCTVCGNELRCH